MRCLGWPIIVGVLILSGCASQVSGRGIAAPVSVSPTTPTPGSTTTAPKPVSVNRQKSSTRLGDVETRDLCAGIDLVGFEKVGVPGFHLYQIAGGCFIDVAKGSNVMLVDIVALQEVEQIGFEREPLDLISTADTTTQLGTGYSESKWKDDGTECRRAFGAAANATVKGVGVSITEEQLRGKSTATTRCAAADEALRQVSHLYRHVLPARAIAAPSVTQFDLCNAITIGGKANLQSYSEAHPQSDGASCEIAGDGSEITIRPAFLSPTFPYTDHPVYVSGHHLNEEGNSHGCEVISRQGLARPGAIREILDLIITSDTATEKQMCQDGGTVMVDILRATGLH